MSCICHLVSHFLVYVFKGVNVCVYVGEGLHRSFATPNPFVLTNKICLNQWQYTNITFINTHKKPECRDYHIKSLAQMELAVFRVDFVSNKLCWELIDVRTSKINPQTFPMNVRSFYCSSAIFQYKTCKMWHILW